MTSPLADSAGRRPPSYWGVLLVCALAQFMVVLDVSIVNVALPQMRDSLGLTVSAQQWVVNAYTLTFAGFLMLGGRAADLFGRRRVFLTGLVLFTAASLLGGLAQGGAWLIAARAAQGLGGAVLAPTSLSLLTSTFTDPGQRRRAMGVWSATAASGAAAGVLAGGVLTDLLDWRWVLFVNVPIGLALLAVTPFVLSPGTPAGSSGQGPRARLDVAGATAITAGLALFVYGIVSTDTRAWSSPQIIAPLAGGVALLLVALLIEARLASSPLVPLGIFRRRSLVAANGIAMVIGAALFGMYFFLSLYLQQVAGYSPLRTGLAILPAGTMTLAGSLAAARLVARIGAKWQLVVGPVLSAAGLLWMSFLSFGDGYLGHMFVPLALFGLGIGTTFTPMTLTATAGVPPREAGLASGLVNTARQVGGAVGLAVLATLAAGATRDSAVRSAQAALTAGYDRAFGVAGLLLLAAAALALLIRPQAPAGPGPAAPAAAGAASTGPVSAEPAGASPGADPAAALQQSASAALTPRGAALLRGSYAGCAC